MATRQQRIKLERARQQQAAAARQQQPSRPLGAEAIDAIERDLAAFSQLPGVRQGLQFVGGAVKVVNEAVLDPLRYASEEQLAGREADPGAALLGHVVRGFEYGVQKGEEGGAIIAERLNVDPRIGSFLGGTAAETLLTAGAGTVAKKAVKAVDVLTPPTGMIPAMAGAAPMPSPMQLKPTIEKGGMVMKAVTARDPESLRLVGVKTGEDIISPEQAKQLVKRSLKVEQHLAKIDSLETGLIDALDTGANAYTIKRLRANLKKERPKLYSARSNISVPTPEDPLYYGTAAARRDRQAVALTEGVAETLEEHHLFPKVVSAAFFGKMDELIKAGKAELDDLVLMNRVAIAKGRKPGDYKSGMYILGETPHNEYHTLMKEAGDEFKRNQAETWAGVVNEAKDVDDLLVLWRDTLDNLVVPTAEDIQSYNKLDKLLQEIRSTPYKPR